MRYKWNQFSLKALFLAINVIALPLGWYSYERYSYRQQWKSELVAISRLAELGAIPIYGESTAKALGRPEWLRHFIGDKYLERIVGIAFQGECNGEMLSLLDSLDTLSIETVVLNKCLLEGPALRHLRECTQLRRIRIIGGALKGEGFEHVFLVSGLVALRLEGFSIPSDKLRSLGQAKNLEVLELSAMTLRTHAIESISRLHKLRELILANSQLCDLSSISGLKSLESLDLSGTNLSDELFAEIEHLPNLRHLNLSNTRIRNVGASLLTRFESLESVALSGISLQSEELATLQLLPRLQTITDSSGTRIVSP